MRYTLRFISLGLIGICPSLLYSQQLMSKLMRSGAKQPIMHTYLMKTPPLSRHTTIVLGSELPQNHTGVSHIERGLIGETLRRSEADRQRHLASIEKWDFVFDQRKLLESYVKNGQWPVYHRNLPTGDAIKYINAWMEIENPNEYVRQLQEDLIYERWVHRARQPKELVRQVNHWLKRGRVPPRAVPSSLSHYTDEEITLGEDLAFGVAAFGVELKENALGYHPWRIPGMAEIVDRVNTYYAMRRHSSVFEGLPEMDSQGEPNFPIWTQQEFIFYQQSWSKQHPFDYLLALYREPYLGQSKLADEFNTFSLVEKQSFWFTSAMLPRLDPTQFSSQIYDKAVERWIRQHGRSPQLQAISQENRIRLIALLLNSAPYKPQDAVLFDNVQGKQVSFAALPYEQQLEVLMWGWKSLHISPVSILSDLYRRPNQIGRTATR